MARRIIIHGTVLMFVAYQLCDISYGILVLMFVDARSLEMFVSADMCIGMCICRDVCIDMRPETCILVMAY